MSSVLVIGKFYPPFSGGIEASTKDVSTALAKKTSVKVICFNHLKAVPQVQEEKIDNVTVVRYRPLLTFANQPVSIRFFLNIIFTRAEIIHLHAPNMVASSALWLRKAMNIRGDIVITHHMDIFGRGFLRALTIPFYKSIIRKSKAVIVTSLKNVKISRDIPNDAKVHAIPLGLKIEDYPASNINRVNVLKGMGLNPEIPVVGFLGRHARYKGLDVLVAALATLPGVQAIIAGDGPLHQTIKNLVASHNIQDRVKFTGIVSHSEKIDILSSIDAFVFPSTEVTEAFGVSQLEAMLVGAPVIASDLPTGVTDVSIHEETAILVPPAEPALLAKAIERMIVDDELKSRISKNAKNRVISTFNNKILIDKHVNIVLSPMRILEAHE